MKIKLKLLYYVDFHFKNIQIFRTFHKFVRSYGRLLT